MSSFTSDLEPDPDPEPDLTTLPTTTRSSGPSHGPCPDGRCPNGPCRSLTATEWRLLSYLAAQRGRVVSKEQVLIAVWGYENYDPNLVEVHVCALRRKLGGPPLLHTVRGLGYVLRPELP